MTRNKNNVGVVMKLRDMDEKNMHNLFLKNMAGLIEETKNPSPCLNPSVTIDMLYHFVVKRNSLGTGSTRVPTYSLAGGGTGHCNKK